MSNPYLTGSFNKYKNKIKGNMKMNMSITPNTKITQYLERKKNNNNHHKSPSNLLNKSQNIRENQKISKINLKNFIMNKKINRRHLNHNNIKVKPHNRKSNSINPSRNNFSIKLNSMNNLPGCYINNNNTNLIKNNINNPNNIINNNKTMSKNNSLSFYYSSNYNTTNNKNKNIGKINNDYTLNKLMCIKANLSYYSNFNYNKGINKLQKKNPSVNLTTDNSNSRNLKSSPCNYFITEESKIIMKDKNRIKNKSKLKMSYLNLKKNKKKSGNLLLTKIKPNIPLKIPHKNSYYPPQMSLVGDISIEKNNPSPPIDTFELKIINELKKLKEFTKDEKMEKLKKIYEESIEYFIPKEYRKIFALIMKEFDYINKENLNEIKNLKEKNDEINKKLNEMENSNKILKKKLEENSNELNLLKQKLIENVENFNNQFNNNEINYRNHFNEEEFENEYNEEEDEDEEEDKNNNIYYNNIGQISNKFSKLKRNNFYFTQLNRKNLDDLDAIYFFDKINNNRDGKKVINNNKESLGNNYNYINNNGEIVPELNLDPKYIEDCKAKELLKIEEAHLSPFQRIALQFEMS